MKLDRGKSEDQAVVVADSGPVDMAAVAETGTKAGIPHPSEIRSFPLPIMSH